VRFTLNGAPADVGAHPMKRLLDVLREECELTGTKEGCGEGECGACTVLIDGAPVCCFMDEVGAQCGICTPGMIMAAYVLDRKASLEDIRVGLAGNLCRCTGYSAIYRAVQAAQRQ